MTAKKVRTRRRASFSKWEIGSQSNGTGRTGISGSLKDKYKNINKYKYKYKDEHKSRNNQKHYNPVGNWITKQ